MEVYIVGIWDLAQRSLQTCNRVAGQCIDQVSTAHNRNKLKSETYVLNGIRVGLDAATLLKLINTVWFQGNVTQS